VALTVREALDQRKLYCAFQPIVDLATGFTFGFESLARSEVPDFPHPGALFAAAIAEGMVGELGRAFRAMSTEVLPNSTLFLNMHPDEFAEPWLVRPDDALTLHDRDVYLEVTESVPLSHYQYCHSVLREIRGRGVKIAVDDLGAGYSNLKYIADLTPEIVKLDRGLVAGLKPGSAQQRLVKSIVSLCREMGARVVAEGIETAAELRAVMDCGVHYGQGYYIARPHREPPRVDWAKIKPT
jgi:EAL domain-containing protein (putative c-di-GMP-specific phosphodiesterase class I)